MHLNPALLALYAYCTIVGFLIPLTVIKAGDALNIINTLIMTFIMMWWTQRDAVKHGRSMSTRMRWLMVMTGPIGLIVHFFQTRSIFGASLAIVVAVMVALLTLVFITAGAAGAWFACQFDMLHDSCPPEFLGG